MPAPQRPQWQRARILRVTRHEIVPGARPGVEVWVRCQRPKPLSDDQVPRYEVNFRNQANTDWLAIKASAIELLARGPEDFCNDPPRIPWGAW